MPRKKEDRADATRIAKRLGQRLRLLRKATQLTQEKVSDLIGLTTEAYARIERGISLPSYPTMMRICGALGTCPDVLLTEMKEELDGYDVSAADADDPGDLAALVYDLKRMDPRLVRDLSLIHI